MSHKMSQKWADQCQNRTRKVDELRQPWPVREVEAVSVRAAAVPDQEITAPRRDGPNPVLERRQRDVVQVPDPVLLQPPGCCELLSFEHDFRRLITKMQRSGGNPTIFLI